MFKKRINQIGKHTQITLENKDRSIVFSILPQLGGCVSLLKLNGISILDEFADATEIETNPAYKNVFLLPFPNRLKDGKYNFNGKTYQFPINDKTNNTALHGFTDFNNLQIASFESNEKDAHLVLKGDYDGSNPAYPFSFETTLSFELTNDNTFTATIQIQNTDNSEFPIGTGWHPYFKLGEKINDCQLQLPLVQKVICDDNMIPVGKTVSFDKFNDSSTINDTQLDTAFLLSSTAGKAKVIFKNDKTTIEYWQETGIGKFNYLQIYTPDHRNALAIEPMTCNIDAFNNGDGLIVLKPKEILKASFGMKV